VVGVAIARVVVGEGTVDVAASGCDAEFDDLELHALPSNSATTLAPTIAESLRIAHYPAQSRWAWRV
jgi:hypothetical protein